MRTALLILTTWMLAGVASARTAVAEPQSALTEYAYCEIIADHLPNPRQGGVLFDFGQQTGKWAYNYLTDEAGNRLLFNSGIQALNYMVARGWEFVQVYTSGEDNNAIHYLLRISASKLTAAQIQQQASKPGSKAGSR